MAFVEDLAPLVENLNAARRDHAIRAHRGRSA
jgi:hypothetical protein